MTANREPRTKNANVPLGHGTYTTALQNEVRYIVKMKAACVQRLAHLFLMTVLLCLLPAQGAPVGGTDDVNGELST